MKRLMSFLKRHSKKVALLSVVSIAAVSATAIAWGPSRPTYTIEKPADHITFNSITNNPNYGDERTFFDAKPASNTGSGGFKDLTKVSDGQEILVRTYVHNNAAANLNKVATDTKVRISLPGGNEKTMRMFSYVSSPDAQPVEVYDHTDLYGDERFQLEYVPGSAVSYTNAVPSGIKLSDSIVTSGAKIGYTQADGRVPGCFEYTSIVTIKVKVKMEQKTPNFTVNKTVAKDGGSWKENIAVTPGEKINYRIEFKNTGETQLNNVVVKDQLPAHMSYVAGTTKLYNATNPKGTSVADGVVGANGIEIGDYAPGANAIVVFKAQVGEASDELCNTDLLTNVASIKPEGLNPKDDDATVSPECTPEKNPDFEIVKDVRVAGDSNWGQDVTVEYGDTVEYRITVKNTGETDLTNVLVKDNRPTGVEYVPSSLRVNGQPSNDDLFGAGVTIPVIKQGENATITFTARVTKADNEPCELKQLRNIASATPVGLEPKEDDAIVIADCDDEVAYECSALDALALGDRTYQFRTTVKTSDNVSVNKYVYNFGDGSDELNTSNNVVDHQYAQPGTYDATVRVVFTVGNEQKDARCAVKVEVPENPCPYNPSLPADSKDCVPPVTPPQQPPVAVVPATGTTSIIAGLFGASALAYSVYAWVESRRSLGKL